MRQHHAALRGTTDGHHFQVTRRSAAVRFAAGACAACSLLAFGPARMGLCATVVASDNPVILQWYESKWQDVERRAVDMYLSGYSSVLVPPVSKANSTGSAGYDVWDRFDLGSPASPTAFGTE